MIYTFILCISHIVVYNYGLKLILYFNMEQNDNNFKTVLVDTHIIQHDVKTSRTQN